VKKIVKICPVDPEIICLEKKKKLMQAKYIARLASLPSGLNNCITIVWFPMPMRSAL